MILPVYTSGSLRYAATTAGSRLIASALSPWGRKPGITLAIALNTLIWTRGEVVAHLERRSAEDERGHAGLMVEHVRHREVAAHAVAEHDERHAGVLRLDEPRNVTRSPSSSSYERTNTRLPSERPWPRWSSACTA